MDRTRARKPHAWSAIEDAMLRRFRTVNGLTYDEITARLHRQKANIIRRAKLLGLIRLVAKRGPRLQRRCLGPCGKVFVSRGVHNRLCKSCRKLPE